jgi:predicted DCC family thiol-disulfide oxidoreductase YuxK
MLLPSRNGWTGGQYSLFRAALGTFLVVQFIAVVPGWSLRVVGAGLGIILVAGWRDRIAALGLAGLCAFLVAGEAPGSNPTLILAGCLLLLHSILPPAPYGSLSAAGRADPGGGWRMPPGVYASAWLLLAAAYCHGGIAKLADPSWIDGSAISRALHDSSVTAGPLRSLLLSLPEPIWMAATWCVVALELGFAPLAAFPRLRPWIWAALLLLQLAIALVAQAPGPSVARMLVHFFTLDPDWLAPGSGRSQRRPDIVFYDGHCGLCHGFVRFVLAEDRSEPALRFAPLDSEAFRERVAADARAGLPDSVVVLTEADRLLVRSEGALHILASLGGLWRPIAGAARLPPRALRDVVYDAVAKVRHRIVRAPTAPCPVVPPALRSRFL